MKVLDVSMRDVYITLDFSLFQLEAIVKFLDRCTASPNQDDPDWDKIKKYVTEDFFPVADKLVDSVKERNNDT